MDTPFQNPDPQHHLTKRERRLLRKQEKQEDRKQEQRKRSMTRWGVVFLIVVLLGGGAWWLMAGSGSTDSTANTDLGPDVDPGKGPQDAKALVREFSDFQCPACKATEPAVDAILAEFGDRIRFEYNDFPLTSIHKNAQKAAEAGQCAYAQDKFWEYHDKLFETQSDWSSKSDGDAKEAFIGFARDLGLDEASFTTCVNDRATKQAVDRDTAEGRSKDVDSTPTFFVNDQKLSNSGELKAKIQEALGEG